MTVISEDAYTERCLFPEITARYIQFAIILSILVFISACSQKQPPAAKRIVAVTVATAKNESIKPSTEFVGRAESTDDVKIRSRVAGVLLKRFFKQGQNVKKDDLYEGKCGTK